MNPKLAIELFGYLGSALVVVSMLMTSVVKLRIINLTGSIIFAIYALIIKSYPTAFMNFFLVGINIYHLMKLRNTHKYFELVEADGNDGYLKFFLDRYEDDIRVFFPDYPAGIQDCETVYEVCCDGAVAGVMMGKEQDGKALEMVLDYSTPTCRDCSVGTFLYGKLGELGYQTLRVREANDKHAPYLQKMGFEKNLQGIWEKRLS